MTHMQSTPHLVLDLSECPPMPFHRTSDDTKHCTVQATVENVITIMDRSANVQRMPRLAASSVCRRAPSCRARQSRQPTPGSWPRHLANLRAIRLHNAIRVSHKTLTFSFLPRNFVFGSTSTHRSQTVGASALRKSSSRKPRPNISPICQTFRGA